jgi:hypothetical protein
VSPNQNPALGRTPSRGYSGDGAGAVPGAAAIHCRFGRPWASTGRPNAGLRGARCTGAGEGPPVCTRRFQEARPGPSRGVKPSAHDRGGRRKARAPPLSIPHRAGEKRWRSPNSQQALVLLRRGRIPEGAPNGARLPSFWKGDRWKGFLTVAWQSSDAKAHRENGEGMRALSFRHPEVRTAGAHLRMTG